MDGENVVVITYRGQEYYDYCWAAINLDNVVSFPKKLQSVVTRKSPRHSAPSTLPPKQDEVIVDEEKVVLKDYQNGLEWALQFRPGVKQAETTTGPGEAQGVCASMGYKLPGINAFMETKTVNGKVTISKHEVRSYWPKLARTFLDYIPAKGAGCRFYTHNVGPFPFLGQSVILFQPFGGHRWDFYSLKRPPRAYALCLRAL